MPMQITSTAGGVAYGNPFVGPVDLVDHVKLDVSDLTTAEVDLDGYLKPGVVLKEDGTLADGTSGEYAYGVTIEATKIATTNTGLASDTSDPLIAVARVALINRDISEDNLGRAYSANELAAIRHATSRLAITTT
jgi:hypothetical protein